MIKVKTKLKVKMALTARKKNIENKQNNKQNIKILHGRVGRRVAAGENQSPVHKNHEPTKMTSGEKTTT
jgi:hypothetical protein